MIEQRTCIPGRLCGGAALFDEIERLRELLTDIKGDLDHRAEMNDWAKVEDPELFFSTLGHTEDGGYVVALGATNYARLCEAVE